MQRYPDFSRFDSPFIKKESGYRCVPQPQVKSTAHQNMSWAIQKSFSLIER